MEIDIIKRETTGTGPSVYHENDTIAKYEIMDGAPVRGKQKLFSFNKSHNANTAQPLRVCLTLQESPSPSDYFWLDMI